jgi:hypothetical protein
MHEGMNAQRNKGTSKHYHQPFNKSSSNTQYTAYVRKLMTQWTTFCRVGFFIASGVGLSPWYYGHFWPIVPAPDDRWGWLWSNWRNEDWQGKPKYSEKTFPSATLSTTNPTWPDPGSNPGCRGGKPATNRLSYGAAFRVGLVPSDTFLAFLGVVW